MKKTTAPMAGWYMPGRSHSYHFLNADARSLCGVQFENSGSAFCYRLLDISKEDKMCRRCKKIRSAQDD